MSNNLDSGSTTQLQMTRLTIIVNVRPSDHSQTFSTQHHFECVIEANHSQKKSIYQPVPNENNWFSLWDWEWEPLYCDSHCKVIAKKSLSATSKTHHSEWNTNFFTKGTWIKVCSMVLWPCIEPDISTTCTYRGSYQLESLHWQNKSSVNLYAPTYLHSTYQYYDLSLSQPVSLFISNCITSWLTASRLRDMKSL